MTTDGADDFRILFVADVFGRPGRAAVAALLPGLRAELDPHLTIVNGENSAGGFGITAATARELCASGADLITTGNHVWDQKQFVDEIAQADRVLGVQKDAAIQRFLTGMPHRFETASGVVTFNSVLVTISRRTGRATSIQRIDREHT